MPSNEKRKILAEPSTAAGIALIVSAVAQAVQHGADAVAATGEIVSAVVPVVTGLLGLLAVFMPEKGKGNG